MNHAVKKQLVLKLSIVLITLLLSSGSGFCDKPVETRTFVYYFHRTIRCASCNLMEQLTRTAVQTMFEKELQVGTVEFKSINVDEKENEHFIKDYNLSAQSVVLSKVIRQKETGWKNLDRVWDFLHKEPQFTDYIQDKLQTFIAASHFLPVKQNKH